MAASASLSPGALMVEPGGDATCEIRVRNAGTVVDQFSFEVLGAAAPWASVEPPVLPLFPGAEGTAVLHFRPPRTAETRSGAIPFGVKVTSREDPDGTVVEEGTLSVGQFLDAFAELIPRTSRGSRSARHDLALDNRGNERINATLSAKDPDEVLSFSFDPASLVAEPGTAVFSRVTVRPRKRFLRGPEQTRPFQVLVEPEGASPLAADGTLLQAPVIPRWLPRAVVALLALLLLLGVLWATLLKPTVESAAKDAVKKPLAAQAAQIADLQKKTTGTTTAPVTGGEVTTTTSATASGVSVFGNPFDRRLVLDVKSATTGSANFTVDGGQILSITDIVLQNPQGDIGVLRLKRGGDILMEVNLANFRDLDYHFVSPVVFNGGAQVVLEARCDNPNPPGDCRPAAYLAGFQRKG